MCVCVHELLMYFLPSRPCECWEACRGTVKMYGWKDSMIVCSGSCFTNSNPERAMRAWPKRLMEWWEWAGRMMFTPIIWAAQLSLLLGICQSRPKPWNTWQLSKLSMMHQLVHSFCPLMAEPSKQNIKSPAWHFTQYSWHYILLIAIDPWYVAEA
jgi:hypothetical protein